MKRPRRGRGQNIVGAALIAIAVSALAAFALAAVLLRPPPVDADTLCRTDAPLAAHTVILVDSTDRLERRHKRLLQAIARQERARLGQYDRLTLMRLDARHPHEPRIIFSKCLPKTPETVNPLFENPRLAQQHWDAAFEDALDHAVRSASAGSGQQASPILASIRAVAADPDFSRSIPHRRLVLVSDLLEHDPNGFSLYADGATYQRWLAMDRTGAADLSDVAVRVAMLDRPDEAARQAAARNQFWPSYLEDSGARSVAFDPAP